MLKLLSQLGKVLPAGGAIDPAELRSEIQNSPVSVQNVLQTALAQMATQVPAQSDPNLLLKIAEHLAIQFALERFEKGEVRVNAVRELLDRMGNEIETLRKVLREHEEKMGRAGLMVESYAEVLDRQFWAAVPENGKRAVLLSPDAWCIPPRNIRDYVKQLLDRRDLKTASAILDTYSSSIKSADADARRRTAMGLSELAELYAQTDPELLRNAIQRTGEQLQGRARAGSAEPAQRDPGAADPGSCHPLGFPCHQPGARLHRSPGQAPRRAGHGRAAAHCRRKPDAQIRKRGAART